MIICMLLCLTLVANFGTASVIQNTPSKPELLNYTIEGKTNTSYNYTVRSTSQDNKSLKYVFDWGDGTNTTTDYLPNATATTQSHTWIYADVYNVWVQSIDYNNVSSEKTRLAVLIDTIVVGNIGYLIDQNGDGVYNVFESAEGVDFHLITNTTKQANETYLIDSNGDTKWDYTYDQNTNTLTPYPSGEETPSAIKPTNALWYALTLGTIIGIALLVAIYIAYEKLKKKQ